MSQSPESSSGIVLSPLKVRRTESYPRWQKHGRNYSSDRYCRSPDSAVVGGTKHAATPGPGKKIRAGDSNAKDIAVAGTVGSHPLTRHSGRVRSHRKRSFQISFHLSPFFLVEFLACRDREMTVRFKT